MSRSIVRESDVAKGLAELTLLPRRFQKLTMTLLHIKHASPDAVLRVLSVGYDDMFHHDGFAHVSTHFLVIFPLFLLMTNEVVHNILLC